MTDQIHSDDAFQRKIFRNAPLWQCYRLDKLNLTDFFSWWWYVPLYRVYDPCRVVRRDPKNEIAKVCTWRNPENEAFPEPPNRRSW